MNIVVKNLALTLAANSFALKRRLKRIADSGVLTILSLHRVAPADGSAYPPLDPDLFRGLLEFLAREFEIVLFSQIKDKAAWPKPPLVLSFDDGYRDFIDYAVPILEEKKVRANQNVIPACADGGRPPLNVLVQDFMGMAPAELVGRLEIEGYGRVDISRGRIAAGNAVSAHLKSRSMVEQKRFEADLLPQMAAWDGFRPTPMMTRSAIASIAAVHEIGAHSYEHASMAFETDDYVRADARRCRHWFREVLGEDPTIYAFPNGAYRPVQVDIVRQAGFETVLLVDEDFSHCESTVHKRFGIYGAGLRELKFRAVGGRRRPSRRAAR